MAERSADDQRPSAPGPGLGLLRRRAVVKIEPDLTLIASTDVCGGWAGLEGVGVGEESVGWEL